MNSLPRFVAMALFVVLAALVALLAMPVWRGGTSPRSEVRAKPDVEDASAVAAPSRDVSTRARVLSQRAALLLAAIGLALTLVLVLSQALRPNRATDTAAPFERTRAEVGALAKLAQSSVAQGEELSRERDVRRLAE